MDLLSIRCAYNCGCLEKDYFVDNSENLSTINDVGWQQIDS